VRKHRFILIVVALVILLSPSVFARQTRIGIEAGSPSLVLIVRPEPFDIKVGYDFTGLATGGAGTNFIHVSGDIRLIDSYQLIDFLHLFLSLGAYAQVQFVSGSADFALGARVPVGLQAYLLSGKIEIFVEVVPTFGFLPTLNAFDQWQGWIGVTLPLPKLR
jgi:hypothetical protein